MIKITTTKGEDIYLNPSFITAVRPDEDEETQVHYFASTSFVTKNLVACSTYESVESVVGRINNQ